MRIIGGRDYYDSATAQYGFDDSICFVRKSTLVPADSSPMSYRIRRTSAGIVHRFDIFLAGTSYRGLFIENSHSLVSAKSRTLIYTQEQANDWVKLNNLNSWDSDIFDLTLSPARTNAIREWALDTKTTVAVSGAYEAKISEFNRRGYDLFNSWNRREHVLLNSDCLKDIEFYRVVPPVLAHSAIASWVGGVLPFNAPTVQLSDCSKIRKAGFDVRTSFRRAKAK